MKDLRWPHVAVVLGALAVLGTLAYFEKDSATVVTGVVVLLGVMGFVAHQQSEIKQTASVIKEQTNGTNSELLRIIERLQAEKTELALRVPPPVEAEPLPAEISSD